MAFSRAIKEKALVAAGRRCCLCTRFKGVRLEVHHIRPESGGGSNDFDNAIPLCFDCHADVGHYNSDHPRGNRYSYTELRRHRDRLYVQLSQDIFPPTDAQEEWAYCRYLICKNFSAFSEIVRGHLDRVPVDNPLLADTIALPEMRRLVQIQGNNDRRGNVHSDWFPNAEEYYAKHSSLEDPQDADCPVYPYFDGIRMPDEDEIRTKVGPTDPISVHLLDAGAPPEDVCVALCHDDPCGGGFPELYETRPIWAVFLEIRNISSIPWRWTPCTVWSTTRNQGTGGMSPLRVHLCLCDYHPWRYCPTNLFSRRWAFFLDHYKSVFPQQFTARPPNLSMPIISR